MSKALVACIGDAAWRGPTRSGLKIPAPLAAYLNIVAGALTPCALFAIGLGLSAEGLRTNLNASIALAAIKLVLMPLIVCALCLATNLNPLDTIAAVICAAMPTAKTVFILTGTCKVDEELVASTASITTRRGNADGMAVCAGGAWGAAKVMRRGRRAMSPRRPTAPERVTNDKGRRAPVDGPQPCRVHRMPRGHHDRAGGSDAEPSTPAQRQMARSLRFRAYLRLRIVQL